MGYTTPEDIANRALQHCGVPPTGRITTLSENSKNAKECALAYHKLRRAELRRNVWRFSIRHAVLRAVDTTTKIFVAPAYVAGTTYVVGDIASYTDPVDAKPRWYLSTQAANTGNTPSSGAPWANYFGPVTVSSHDSTLAYYAGEIVYDAGNANAIWISLVSSNTAALAEGTSWHQLTGTLQPLNLIYPIGAGPLSSSVTRNVFRLPYGFLREAAQDPKAGAYMLLGASTGAAYSDWDLEGDYIISSDSMILLRFVADWADVSTMDAMFCEGMAARLGYEICESITQSGAKVQTIQGEYKLAMSEARTVNGIETGPTEPPEDDFIAVRN